MRTRRILGIILIVLGVCSITLSFYIKSQVKEGRKQISGAQEKINKGKELFSLNPLAKDVGKSITNPIEKKLKKESTKADKYDTVGTWLQIGGVVAIVIGGFLIFIGRKKE